MDLTMKRVVELSSPITCLPNDLLVEITTRVASSSLAALIDLKLSCKEFSEIAEDKQVLRRVFLENQPAVDWKKSSIASSFRQRCEESENPEALFKLGMVKYFSCKNMKTGEELLRKASSSRHLEATYVLGIMLFSQDDSRREGMELLNKIEAEKMDNCRERSKKVLHDLWFRTRLSGFAHNCVHPMCRNGLRRGCPRRGEWDPWDEDNFCSEICKCVYHYNSFVNN